MNAITKGYEDVPMTRRRAQLLAQYATLLTDMLENAPDDQDLAEWVQSKIDRAAAAIQSAYHYLDQEEEEDELEKAAGHKYTHRKRVGTDKRGRARYRYYYQEHHGGGITSAKFEAGSSFKLTYRGRRGHFHIQSVEGDMVTITHDGRPGMKPVSIHRDELRALLKKQHGKALEAHVEKRRREVEALDRDRSRKRSGLGLALHRLRQAADKAGISLPEQYQRKPKKTRAPAQEPREDNFETMPESASSIKERYDRLQEKTDTLEAKIESLEDAIENPPPFIPSDDINTGFYEWQEAKRKRESKLKAEIETLKAQYSAQDEELRTLSLDLHNAQQRERAQKRAQRAPAQETPREDNFETMPEVESLANKKTFRERSLALRGYKPEELIEIAAHASIQDKAVNKEVDAKARELEREYKDLANTAARLGSEEELAKEGGNYRYQDAEQAAREKHEERLNLARIDIYNKVYRDILSHLRDQKVDYVKRRSAIESRIKELNLSTDSFETTTQSTQPPTPRNELTETAQQIIEEVNQEHEERHDEHQEITKFELGEHTHTKTGQKLFTAKQKERTDRDEYFRRVEIAKKYKGRYERRYVKGFVFRTAEDARAFALEVEGAAQAPEASAETVTPHEDHPSADNFETMPEVESAPTQRLRGVLDALSESERLNTINPKNRKRPKEAKSADAKLIALVNELAEDQDPNDRRFLKVMASMLQDVKKRYPRSAYERQESRKDRYAAIREFIEKKLGIEPTVTAPSLNEILSRPTTPNTQPSSAYYGRATKKLVDQALSSEPTGISLTDARSVLPSKGDLRQMLSQEQRLKRAKEDLVSTGAPNFLGQKNPIRDIMYALSGYLNGPYVELGQGRIREMERGLKIALRDSKGEELEQVKDETARFWREWGGEYKRLHSELVTERTQGEALRNIRPLIPDHVLTPEINQLLDQMERELDQKPVSGKEVSEWIDTRDTNKATRDRQPTTPRDQLIETAREVTTQPTRTAHTIVLDRLIQAKRSGNEAQEAQINEQLRPQLLSLLEKLEQGTLDDGERQALLTKYQELETLTTGAGKELAQEIVSRLRGADNFETMPETDTQPAPDPSPARAQLAETVREISEPASSAAVRSTPKPSEATLRGSGELSGADRANLQDRAQFLSRMPEDTTKTGRRSKRQKSRDQELLLIHRRLHEDASARLGPTAPRLTDFSQFVKLQGIDLPDRAQTRADFRTGIMSSIEELRSATTAQPVSGKETAPPKKLSPQIKRDVNKISREISEDHDLLQNILKNHPDREYEITASLRRLQTRIQGAVSDIEKIQGYSIGRRLERTRPQLTREITELYNRGQDKEALARIVGSVKEAITPEATDTLRTAKARREAKKLISRLEAYSEMLSSTVQKSLSAPKLTKMITYRAQLIQTVERLTA